MTNREAGSRILTTIDRVSRLSVALRPGLILGVAVAGVVGLVGLVQWDEQLMLTGLIAASVIVVLNLVIVAARHLHGRNTDPSAAYMDAEDVVMMRRPKARR